jgi:hypothetical protein
MFIAATFSLLAAVLAPQTTEKPQGAEPVLKASETKSLSGRLRKYLSADTTYQAARGRVREKASKTLRKTREAFEKEWKKYDKRGLLGSMVDLRAVFYNCFKPEKSKIGKGSLLEKEVKDTPVKYAIRLPRKYTEKKPWGTILSLPSGKEGSWMRPRDYFSKIWGKSAIIEQFIMQIPHLPAELEMDPIPNYSRDRAEEEENKRIGSVFGAFGFLINNYTVDRARVFLDCGTETCGFGVRFATLFPDRWAGLILRDVTEVDDLRIGNLLSVPILVLKTPNNAATVTAMKKRWDETCPGMMTVLDAKGDAPHLESADDILAWVADKKRSMVPMKITLEPNHDRFNRAYWVDIHVADSLLNTSGDERPRLQAVADRAANRITIDAVGIERFEILLNDDLVDLSKEFTIVVNGKAVKETRRRSFGEMKRRMLDRNDWDYIFPVKYVSSVPKE